jgi:hypothetical protein
MIRASDWRPMQRNTLQGFLTLYLEPSGLVLRDCTFHRMTDGREWVGLPSRPQIDREGNHRQDPKTGKPAYIATVEIPDKEQREQFQRAALAAIRKLMGEPAGTQRGRVPRLWG